MKITQLRLNNWLCHHYLDEAFEPLTVVCGPNHSGKSAIVDAIAFAMIGELRRVKLKGDRAQLLSDGAKAGLVHVAFDNGHVSRDVATGKPGGDNVLVTHDCVLDALPFVLDRERFCRADANERRLLLQEVMCVDLGPDGLLRTLAERGYSAPLLAKLKPGAAVAIWLEQAERGASEARGAWKAVTGGVYGSEKAKVWEAPCPANPPDEEQVDAAAALTLESQERLRVLQVEVGVWTADAEREKREQEQLAEWGKLADTLADEKARLDAAEQAVQETDAAQVSAAGARHAAAGEAADGSTLTCPDCGVPLALDQDRLVLAREGAMTASDIAVLVRAGFNADAAAASAVKRRDAFRQRVIAAEAAKLSRDQARAKARNETTSGATMAELTAQIADAQAGVKSAVAVEHGLTLAHLEARRSAEQTTKAAAYHAAVQAWVALRDALLPDGVPGELLASALRPFNDALRTMAEETGWPQVTLTADMDVLYGGRTHGLLSRSERWRADAMVAVALATHSGIRVVALDEFDVLDVASRGQAMGWLYGLTKESLDTVIVLATLKAAPPVPSDVGVIWLGAPGAASSEAAA